MVKNTSRSTNLAVKTSDAGRAVWVNRGAYDHWGRLTSQKTVVHPVKKRGQKAVWKETSLDEFSQGDRVQVDRKTQKWSDSRIRNDVGRKGYNVFNNNCEQIAKGGGTGQVTGAAMGALYGAALAASGLTAPVVAVAAAVGHLLNRAETRNRSRSNRHPPSQDPDIRAMEEFFRNGKGILSPSDPRYEQVSRGMAKTER